MRSLIDAIPIAQSLLNTHLGVGNTIQGMFYVGSNKLDEPMFGGHSFLSEEEQIQCFAVKLTPTGAELYLGKLTDICNGMSDLAEYANHTAYTALGWH